jgi:hypothetical protein
MAVRHPDNPLTDFVRSFRGTQKRLVCREVPLSATDPEALSRSARQPSPAEALVIREVRQAMSECIATLSEQHQRVLCLRRDHGLSFPQAGGGTLLRKGKDAPAGLRRGESWTRAESRRTATVDASRTATGRICCRAPSAPYQVV